MMKICKNCETSFDNENGKYLICNSCFNKKVDNATLIIKEKLYLKENSKQNSSLYITTVFNKKEIICNFYTTEINTINTIQNALQNDIPMYLKVKQIKIEQNTITIYILELEGKEVGRLFPQEKFLAESIVNVLIQIKNKNIRNK